MGDRKGHPVESGNFYLIITRPVLNDSRLSSSAKLLFGLITSLQTKTGYCYASNEFLAKELGVTCEDTITKLVRKLKETGYITIEIERDEQTKKTLMRKIFPCILPADTSVYAQKNFCGDTRKFSFDDPENFMDKEGVGLESVDDNPPKAPQGAGVARKSAKAVPKHKPERFEAFWEAYPRHESRVKAVRAWDRLRPDDALLDTMARALKRQLASEDWQRGIGIPYAVTWINGQRWEDEVKPAPMERNVSPHYDPRGGLPEC